MPSEDSVQLVLKSSMQFPFLRLPAEIRRYFYALVLPNQDVGIKSGEWAGDLDGAPNPFMNLLLVNKQISDEARTVLYGSNCFTIALSEDAARFTGYHKDAQWFRPFKQSFPYIRNWQLRLRFDPRYRLGSPLILNQYYIRQRVNAAVERLAGTPDLQTLKISVPCLCKKGEQTSNDTVRDSILFALEPLLPLRFLGKVRFIAAAPTKAPCDEVSMPMAALMPAANMQCQQPACVAFAASFGHITTLLQSSGPRTALTSKQESWLQLKATAYSAARGSTASVRYVLDNAWRAMENKSEAKFIKYCERSRKMYEEPVTA
ncbi:MAG: hypothetical protein LQ338_004299 [Usnochroma carphineum]|nr:MAG: hypothetical protein LQ338_004299 [Usnochroma carphineum]